MTKAKELFQHLKRSGLTKARGTIKFELLDTEVNISKKSAIGNLLQEWLEVWMSNSGIYHRENQNSQVFPDFYLGANDEHDLLELKTFDYTKTPNFDIANFDAYVRSLREHSNRLNADYLIMGYTLKNGEIKINDIWLKKVWEITCPSEQYKIKTQVKQGKITNIRPYNFKNQSKGYQPFRDLDSFLIAIAETLQKYKDQSYAENWLNEVKSNYLKFNNK
jgi:hypothetical protein